MVQTAYRLTLNTKEEKRYLELRKDDAKREVVYRQCIKNISEIIEKSDVSEDDYKSSYTSQVPGCLKVGLAMHFELLRFDFFTDTLLNKKRFQQASAAKQN